MKPVKLDFDNVKLSFQNNHNTKFKNIVRNLYFQNLEELSFS